MKILTYARHDPGWSCQVGDHDCEHGSFVLQQNVFWRICMNSKLVAKSWCLQKSWCSLRKLMFVAHRLFGGISKKLCLLKSWCSLLTSTFQRSRDDFSQVKVDVCLNPLVNKHQHFKMLMWHINILTNVNIWKSAYPPPVNKRRRFSR